MITQKLSEQDIKLFLAISLRLSSKEIKNAAKTKSSRNNKAA